MKKYQLTEQYEMNIIGDMSIVFSQDLTKIYQAGKIETIIISAFKAPITIQSVKERVCNIEKFNEDEFILFISNLIERNIISETKDDICVLL